MTTHKQVNDNLEIVAKIVLGALVLVAALSLVYSFAVLPTMCPPGESMVERTIWEPYAMQMAQRAVLRDGIWYFERSSTEQKCEKNFVPVEQLP